MTAGIPRQRRPLADTAAVAKFLHRSPGYVRLLVHQGRLAPVKVERTSKGARRMLFDLDAVTDAVADTPSILGGA